MSEIFGKIANVLEKIPHADHFAGFFEVCVGALFLIEGSTAFKVAGLAFLIHGISAYSDVIRRFDGGSSNS